MLLSIAASAQNKAGGISADILKDLNASFEGNAADKAIRNALNNTSMALLAASADKSVMPDTNFSYEVKTNGRTDQKSSGRCWLFTGLNVLRAQMMARHNLDEFTFSQNYLFFYDQLEKSNLFLQGVIDTRKLPMEDRKVDWLFSHPIGDGGQFTGVSNLIMKYGVVPSEAMPETYSANNTSAMRTQLSLILREGGLKLRAAKEKEVQALKVGILKDVYRVLALCLGVPPKEFTWRKDGKTYTPQEFYQQYLISMQSKDTKTAFFALLHAAWACDDRRDEENAKNCRYTACLLAEQLLSSERKNDENLSLIRADLLRRTGQFSRLIEEYSNIQYSEDLMNDIIAFQLEKAKAQDTGLYRIKDVTGK